MPAFADLPVVQPLTDPFEWSDGSGRDTTFENWSRRRAEIAAEIQHYEIGFKAPPPDTIMASFVPSETGGVLTVDIVDNGDTLTLTSNITLPQGQEGPFPAIIGMTFAPGFGGNGSLPADIFSSRNIATIEFVHNQVTTYSGGGSAPKRTDPYYMMYPDLILAGQYSAWSWGVSRLIDGIMIAAQHEENPLPIDVSHLAATGCSYAGKMALFAGALDERIALTIAQESGGGGAPAWRVSETLGNVERISSTDYSWFMTSMRQFSGGYVSRLPHDHHELLAMVAPRALLVTGNTDYEWLANPSTYVSSRAAQQVYEAFGIGDRFGFYIDGGHGHCAIPASQRPAIEAFVDRFMLGDQSVETDVQVHPYPTVNHERWYSWWGSGNPVFPEADTTGTESIYLEAECAVVGSDWEELPDAEASGGSYVTVQAGLNSTASAPTGEGSTVSFPFTVSKDTTYYFFVRGNHPTADDDSYWVKLNDGPFVMANGLGTNGWQWVDLTSFISSTELTAGDHTLTIAYREDGALLDKVAISSFSFGPFELGDREATNCPEDTTSTGIGALPPEGPVEFSLNQNYPNPFNPSTAIRFTVPEAGVYSLKVFNALGQEVAVLLDGMIEAGSHEVRWLAEGMPSGVYVYRLSAGEFTRTRKMTLLQ